MKTRILSLFLLSVFLLVNSCTKNEEIVAPVATATPMTQTITSGSTTSIALTSSLMGTTFSWTVVQIGVTGATPGNGTSIAQTLSTSGAVAGTATYSVIPTANGTLGSAVSVIITVNPVKVTFNSDIKPLLTASCTPCHLAGGVNPNKWDDYATTKSKITTIIDRFQRTPGTTGFMPRVGTELTVAQIALLNKWAAGGLMEK